ncbi:hypothetical protein VTK73DRAFT_8152 [Phialemonium thermophilum]|uniref:ATP-grasp domain-containing protein n=1 Tax=Phialemonium thermophilum TaxID=223376 RepID=A0ABR3WA90_9PEZI
MAALKALTKARVAVLYQALDPPVLGGVFKPKKPSGYRDSSADIAYTLSRLGQQGGRPSPPGTASGPQLEVVTPVAQPDPANDANWSFPDSEAGILDAVDRHGVTHLWANTILFSTHPLQISAGLDRYQSSLRVVCQPPRRVEAYDDKSLVHQILQSWNRTHDESRRFTLPVSKTVHVGTGNPPTGVLAVAREMGYPVVAKPVRGRGSFGVKVCRSDEELAAHVEMLKKTSGDALILEEYLSGEEATVTVMPVSGASSTTAEQDSTANGGRLYQALPVVTRFGHVDGVAPYNGTVAVSANSRVVTAAESQGDPAYARIMRECEDVAQLLGMTSVIRIDVRRSAPGGAFRIFDVNMKPNMTGPGRPGRDDQTSLSGMAAAGLGWDYGTFLTKILQAAPTLQTLREAQVLHK